MLKKLLQQLFISLYKVEVKGLENFHKAGDRVLIVANHTSFLDALLLGVFLPDDVNFVVNTEVAKQFWIKPFMTFAHTFVMDPISPLSTRALIKFLKQDNKVVIFPEGRITVTGSLMKIYDGSGLVADKSEAMVLPIRIDGAQYTPFSRLRNRIRLRWFPKISLCVLSPTRIVPPENIRGRERRKYAGQKLSEIMTEVIFTTSNYKKTVISALLDARRIHGGRHPVLEDVKRQPITYNGLIVRIYVIGQTLKHYCDRGEYVGVMLPNVAVTVIVMLGLQFFGRVPAMLNYTLGAKSLVSCCNTAKLKVLLTSRQFVEVAKLGDIIDAARDHVKIVYLEDLQDQISVFAKTVAFFQMLTADYWFDDNRRNHQDPAVVLFTSGTEGMPKGVVLSHYNVLANYQQLAAKIDFNAQDTILNALPLFHSFGLTAGTLLPLMSGIKLFVYPSPLHYRIVPEVAYDINATILFGTNTFLAGYVRFAHPYDFYSVRYVFAGAEKLQQETRNNWASKFGIRILEGYGATETSPVLSVNTPMEYREGTVGRFVPGIEYKLEKVPGVDEGARLHVTGPNIMLGYLLADNPGVIQPPISTFGNGWYDTGDIIQLDNEGYITICGRAKRFAKIGGEMVSLAVAEDIASKAWPDSLSAVVSIPDKSKGERLVLITEHTDPKREDLKNHAKDVGELSIPKQILAARKIPILGSGKVDYSSLQKMVSAELAT